MKKICILFGYLSVILSAWPLSRVVESARTQFYAAESDHPGFSRFMHFAVAADPKFNADERTIAMNYNFQTDARNTDKTWRERYLSAKATAVTYKFGPRLGLPLDQQAINSLELLAFKLNERDPNDLKFSSVENRAFILGSDSEACIVSHTLTIRDLTDDNDSKGVAYSLSCTHGEIAQDSLTDYDVGLLINQAQTKGLKVWFPKIPPGGFLGKSLNDAPYFVLGDEINSLSEQILKEKKKTMDEYYAEKKRYSDLGFVFPSFFAYEALKNGEDYYRDGAKVHASTMNELAEYTASFAALGDDAVKSYRRAYRLYSQLHFSDRFWNAFQWLRREEPYGPNLSFGDAAATVDKMWQSRFAYLSEGWSIDSNLTERAGPQNKSRAAVAVPLWFSDYAHTARNDALQFAIAVEYFRATKKWDWDFAGQVRSAVYSGKTPRAISYTRAVHEPEVKSMIVDAIDSFLRANRKETEIPGKFLSAHEKGTFAVKGIAVTTSEWERMHEKYRALNRDFDSFYVKAKLYNPKMP